MIRALLAVALPLVACGSQGAAPAPAPGDDGDAPLGLRWFTVAAPPPPGLQTGFGVAITEQRTEGNGERYGRTRHGQWVPMSRLTAAAPSRFQGVRLVDAPLSTVAWVVPERGDRAAVFDFFRGRPGGAPTGETLARLERVRPTGEETDGWLPIGDHRTLRAVDVRAPRPSARPPEVGAGERWIDVDRERQVLVAYEGDEPRYATLVSTGLAGRSTPPGRRRVRAKLRLADMDDLDGTPAHRYSVEGVPWVQYFGGSAALHGTFWHARFGAPHSHGCVNLSEADARWLFRFTEPALPSGRQAIAGDGTLVQVR